MKFNFNSEFSKDTGVLLFICVRNEPMHKYLTNLDKNKSNYIKQAMKVVNFNYKENNKLDLILPKGSKSDRIIILGVNKSSSFSDIDLGMLGSTITTMLNNKKIKEASLILNDKTFNAYEVALLLYGISLNTYRFNKYFSDKKKIRENFLETINLFSPNYKKIKNEWKRFKAIKEGVFLTRDLVSEPSNNLTPLLLSKEALKLRKTGLKVEQLDEKK